MTRTNFGDDRFWVGRESNYPIRHRPKVTSSSSKHWVTTVTIVDVCLKVLSHRMRCVALRAPYGTASGVKEL